MKKLHLLAGLTLLISFFLPWFEVFIFHASGYDLPNVLQKTANIFSNEKMNIFSYVLYSIPVFTMIHLLMVALDKMSYPIGIITGLIPVCCILYFMKKITYFDTLSDSLFDVLQYGIYITFFSGCFLTVLSCIGLYKKRLAP